MTTTIDIADLTVQRGRRTVLRDFSCRLGSGVITGLLGPSGAGKTTLIRAIVGVQKIRSGSVSVFGLDAGSAPVRSRTGYVTQAVSIYTDLTVEENLRYFAAITGARRHRVDEAIEEVGLTQFAHQQVRNLSGGQRSRASLACALVGDPDLLVLDEPTVGQDPLLREELWAMFRRRADAGATVLVSSHVMDEANRCDRLLLLRDGALLADDAPAAIRRSAGTDDMDAAFLELIQRRASDPATGPASDHRHSRQVTP